MDIETLRKLDLSDQESKIFLALLNLGSASASLIAKEAKVSYGTIYDQLGKLEAKGIVRIIPEKTKKFTLVDPNELTKIIDEKIESLNDTKKAVSEMKQIYSMNAKTPVVIAQGKKNFYALKSEMTVHNKRDYSFRQIFEYNPVSFRKMKEKLKRKVEYKILYGTEADEAVIEKYKKEKIQMRKLPIKGVPIAIHDDEVLISLIEKNTTILIRDKDFADLMTCLFDKTF
jgi:sugar-specific transcriptional regulator TrmB